MVKDIININQTCYEPENKFQWKSFTITIVIAEKKNILYFILFYPTFSSIRVLIYFSQFLQNSKTTRKKNTTKTDVFCIRI